MSVNKNISLPASDKRSAATSALSSITAIARRNAEFPYTIPHVHLRPNDVFPFLPCPYSENMFLLSE